MTTATSVEPLTVRTVELTGSHALAAGALVDVLPPNAPLAWIRGGEGLVGWGEAAAVRTQGPDRFERAVSWWRELCAGAQIEDEVDLPGTGLVVFGSFAFADAPTPSRLVLPRTVLGRRDGRTWLTSIGTGEPDPAFPAAAPRAPGQISFREGALSAQQWRAAVRTGVERIRDGELSKVVLARDLLAEADAPIDTRHLLRGLARHFQSCFTFSVQGLVGATPELLIRREAATVTSRVLAGTAWEARPTDDSRDVAAAAEARESGLDPAGRLLASAKDREEHAYAVRSAAEALEPFCTRLAVPDEPTVLRLANVVHLATEVSGTLAEPHRVTDALTLAGRLHPTAAVCGTPTPAAARLIEDLEGMDRGRYAGPVGWMDARGDGEWGIALRCAEIDGRRMRLFAGCGIVAGSDPDSEDAEATAKFRAVREVITGTAPALR